MKKNFKKLLTASFAFALAIGTGVLLGSKSNGEVKVAEAASDPVDVRGSFNGWTAGKMYLSGDSYTFVRDFAQNETFKVVVNGTDWVAANWNGVTNNTNNGIVDDNTNDHNFKVNTAGKYLIKAAKGIGTYGEKGYGVTIDKYKGRLIVGSFGDWTASTGIVMQHEGNQWFGTVKLDYGATLKIPYFNGSSLEYQTGIDDYSAITPNAQAYKYFGNGDGGNIVCYASGSYTFYFTDDKYDSNYKISIAYNDKLTAEHLAAQLMGADISKGTCEDADKFPAMKAMYLGLEAGEQAKFQGFETSEIDQFKNAYDRYVAWARALGEKPWEAGKVGVNAFSVLGINSSNSSTVIIVIVAALLTATVCAGYFFYRKKKHA
ncbi:MAG: hypothetical protein MJ225_04145 [Bacilli bacterium]|nr:hypothetical protein [Bacilli bacterium]